MAAPVFAERIPDRLMEPVQNPCAPRLRGIFPPAFVKFSGKPSRIPAEICLGQAEKSLLIRHPPNLEQALGMPPPACA